MKHASAVACECECRNGLHGWEDHFLVELIHPDTGKPVAEGESGELVITTLDSRHMIPLVRYNTGDCRPLAAASYSLVVASGL